jgi:membrane associated rhomboid family serine protease
MFERDYAPRERSMNPPMPPVTKALLGINLALFLIDVFSREPRELAGVLNDWGAFTIGEGLLGGHVWQLLTFQFLHASLGHVVFNCIGIYIFGPFVERYWGLRRFIAYYLICGAAGGLFYALLMGVGLLPNASTATPLVGASAGLFGLIFAVYRLAPAVQVRLLFPPITLTIRQLALALACFAVAMILGGLMFPGNPMFWNSGGEAGHLGGAIMGLILMSQPWLLNWAQGNRAKVVRPAAFQRKTARARRQAFTPKVRPRTEVELAAEDEIDRILDKVSEHGFGSLTAEEKSALEQASKRGS